MFILHANGATYEEIEKIDSSKDYKYEFRKIRGFVKEKFKGEL